MSDLRQIPRWQIGEKARMRMRGTDWESKCYIEDLNLKGAKISLKDKLPEHPVFGITLDMKSALTLNVAVQIRWYQKLEDRHYYGIEFTQIRDIEKEEISAYLNKNCHDQFKKHWWPQEEKDRKSKEIELKEVDSKFLEIVDPENFL